MSAIELHVLLAFMLFMVMSVAAFMLIKNTTRLWNWVPVTAEVYWKGEKCEIQSNPGNNSGGWKTRLATDCSVAENVVNTSSHVLSHRQFQWRIHKAKYSLVLFESDGSLHGKLLADGDASAEPFKVGDKVELLHRNQDYYAVYRAYSPHELKVRRYITYTALLLFLCNLWFLRRAYRREVAADLIIKSLR